MYVIDRRRNPQGRSIGNRQRFIRRAREQIREAIRETLRERRIEDVASGEDVVISSDGIHEPRFSRDPQAGHHERVLPGNKEYLEGDRIPKPQGGGAQGSKASPDGDSEDRFAFALTREEFLDLFFEDLELPDLVKRRTAASALIGDRAPASRWPNWWPMIAPAIDATICRASWRSSSSCPCGPASRTSKSTAVRCTRRCITVSS